MRTTTASCRMVLLGALLAAAAAHAQRPSGPFDPEQMLDRQMSQMKEELNLTAEQEGKVRPILKEGFEKMAEFRSKLRDGSGGRPPEMREEMAKVQQETNDQLGKVLTKEQMEKYEKMLQERRGRFGEGGGHGRRNQ